MPVSALALLLSGLVTTSAPQVLVLEPAVVKVDVDDARLLQRRFVQELSRADGLQVLGSADLQRLADLSVQQSTAGCDVGADACLAELADAMGAEFVVFSEVGRLGGRVIWQLGLWDQAGGKIVAREPDDRGGVAGSAAADAIGMILAIKCREEGPARESAWVGILLRDAREQPCAHPLHLSGVERGVQDDVAQEIK